MTYWPGTTIPKSTNNCFNVVAKGVEKPSTAPKKRGPKPKPSKAERSAVSLMTDAEKLTRRREIKAARTAKVLRENKTQFFPNQADADKTASIIKGGI